MHELKRLASMARCFDVEVEVITPAEAGRRWPLMRTDDLAGAVWLPRDGRTNPIDTTLALAKGARQGGATILENTAVTAIRVARRRASRASSTAARRHRLRGRRELRGHVGARSRRAWPASRCRCTPPSTSTS